MLRILFVIILITVLTMQIGCARGSHARSSFCSVYDPVYMSVDDSEETKVQIDNNNAVWLELCN